MVSSNIIIAVKVSDSKKSNSLKSNRLPDFGIIEFGENIHNSL